jgi:hypothetical protein
MKAIITLLAANAALVATILTFVNGFEQSMARKADAPALHVAIDRELDDLARALEFQRPAQSVAMLTR